MKVLSSSLSVLSQTGRADLSADVLEGMRALQGKGPSVFSVSPTRRLSYFAVSLSNHLQKCASFTSQVEV